MQDDSGGAHVRQADDAKLRQERDRLRSAGQSAISPLVSAEQAAAEVFRVSVRTFHELRSQPWMPEPIMLGPRTLRWVRAELEAAVAKMPRTRRAQDPWPDRPSRNKAAGVPVRQLTGATT